MQKWECACVNASVWVCVQLLESLKVRTRFTLKISTQKLVTIFFQTLSIFELVAGLWYEHLEENLLNFDLACQVRLIGC